MNSREQPFEAILTERLHSATEHVSPDTQQAWNSIAARSRPPHSPYTLVRVAAVAAGGLAALALSLAFELPDSDGDASRPASTRDVTPSLPSVKNLGADGNGIIIADLTHVISQDTFTVPLGSDDSVTVVVTDDFPLQGPITATPLAVPLIKGNERTPMVSISRNSVDRIVADACAKREDAIRNEPCAPVAEGPLTLDSGAIMSQVTLPPDDVYTVLEFGPWTMTLNGPDPGAGLVIGEALSWEISPIGFPDFRSTSRDVTTLGNHATRLRSSEPTGVASKAFLSLSQTEQCSSQTGKTALHQSNTNAWWCDGGVEVAVEVNPDDLSPPSTFRQSYESISIVN